MPRVVALVAQVYVEAFRRAVAHRLKQWQGTLGIRHGEQRHYRFLPGLAALRAFVQEFGVFLLDMRSIAEHGIAEIDGRRRGEDGTIEAVLYQGRQVSAMVDVRVREHHGRHAGGIHGQVPVLAVGIFAPPLRQAAIEQVALAVYIQLVQGTGDFACRTPKGQFHLGASEPSLLASGCNWPEYLLPGFLP